VLDWRIAVPIVIAATFACSSDTQPTDPRTPPSTIVPLQAIVTNLTATPNPSVAGQTVDIAMTLTLNNGTPNDGTAMIHWNSTFGVFGGPVGNIPPGTISPRSGGPVPPGTVVHLTYVTTAPVDAVLNIIPSMHPVELNSGAVPQDGVLASFFLHVQ
jgi:hypothetical protein